MSRDDQSPSSSSNSEFKRRERKRKIKFSQTCSDDNENEENYLFPDTSVPSETNHWDEEVLNVLGISLNREELYKPAEITDKLLENLPLLASKRLVSVETIKKRASLIMECLNEFKPLQRLDFDDLIQIRDKENSNYPLFTRGDNGCSEWTVKIPEKSIKAEEHWYHMFKSHADVFAEDLKYMISHHQHDNEIPESMYGVLFKDFIGMFGVHVVTTPATPTRHMQIRDVEVSSTPDMLLMDQLNVVKNTPGAFNMDILSLIQMSKESRVADHASDSGELEDLKVSDSLMAQHIGNLLIHAPSSSCKNHGLMGMLVDKTNVTFTYLSCNKRQLETIMNGKRNPAGYSPTAVFSRSYNFLKNSDREDLIEPLLILGLLQRI